MIPPSAPGAQPSPRPPATHDAVTPPGLRLAVVHDWLTGMRGGEKCLEVLCRRFPEARLLTLLRAKGSASAPIERMHISTSMLQWLPGATRYYRWLLPLMPAAIQGLRIPRGHNLRAGWNCL